MDYEAALKSLESITPELLAVANATMGTSAKTMDEFVDALLPKSHLQLKRLAVLYEQQMLACRDSKAHFAACVMSAAMLESFLLMLCLINQQEVKDTEAYEERAGSDRKTPFERKICSVGFETLIEISNELEWVPSSLISDDWKTALPEAYKEIMRERPTNVSREDRESHATSIAANPAYSLMLLINMMRNKVHAGRWIKEGNELKSEGAFDGWAAALLVGAAHIRDCLVEHHQRALIELMKRAMLEKMKSHGTIS